MVEKSLEVDDRVKQVVVVTDNGVAPGRKIQPQFKRTERFFLCPVLNGLAGKGILFFQHLEQDILNPVKVIFGIGAVIRIAQALRQEADLVLCGKGHSLEPQPLLLHEGKTFLSNSAGRGFGGQIKQMGNKPFSHCLDRRKKRGNCFADSRRCLT